MISTRCCSPTESCQIRASGSIGMWSASEISSTWRTTSRRRRTKGSPRMREGEVVRDRQRLDEAKVLVHHPDPGVDRVARRMELDEAAGDLDLAFVRPVEAGEDVHQRRLPGAVLPEERVDLSRRDVERHVVVREDPREPLRDAAHRHGRPFRDGRGYLVRSGVHEAGPETCVLPSPSGSRRRPSRASPPRGSGGASSACPSARGACPPGRTAAR